MSDRKHVIVVGAGIVGVSTAIWLQRDGHHVTLIDREGPAAGASFGNGGVLASCAVVPVTVPGLMKKAPGMLFSPEQPLFLKWGYLPKLAPWLLRYVRHANDAATRKRARAMADIIGDSLADHLALAKGTPAERFIVPTDYLYLYRDRAAFEADGYGWRLRAENGIEWDEIEGAALAEYEPAYGSDLSFAVRMRDHGRISDPGAYVTALADHAISEGATFLRAEVTEFTRENGRIAGVRAGGETLEADEVVLCTGVWSGPLSRSLGIRAPVESERGYHLELWGADPMPTVPVMVAHAKFVATPMEGRLRLAGVVEFGGLDAPPSRKPFELLEKNIRAAIPGITWERKVEWMGHRPSIVDSLPLIGEAPKAKGAWLGFGHDHVGLTGGPKTGRLLAQLISGRKPNINLAPFDPARFV